MLLLPPHAAYIAQVLPYADGACCRLYGYYCVVYIVLGDSVMSQSSCSLCNALMPKYLILLYCCTDGYNESLMATLLQCRNACTAATAVHVLPCTSIAGVSCHACIAAVLLQVLHVHAIATSSLAMAIDGFCYCRYYHC